MGQSLKGLLVVNHFLRTEKFFETYDFIKRAAEEKKLELALLTNLELITRLGASYSEAKAFIDGEGYDFVLFWDKDTRLAEMLEGLGLRLFNSAGAIEACDDKSLTYVKLLASGIRMPRTILSPKAFEAGVDKSELHDYVESELSYPFIMKECYGSFGREVYLIENRIQLEEKEAEIGLKPLIYQEFISSSYGRDLRVNVVGDRVIAGLYREAKNGDFRANLTLGGSMRVHEVTEEEAELALRATRALGLDFAGVDLLFGEGGERFVAEVNSNSQFVNLYHASGVNMPLHLFDYIKRELRGE